ncbi:hypothetical protein HPG69_007774 [Diceros bicornis minor]|uniref:Uncharacterized protein n=1 Tax=Diceros bicornis minor TaxID=77932 RepID=A0A7J7EB12_DICBM|nr:hypothetical protein HPG69_007774 [Diceros bicornis minor]
MPVRGAFREWRCQRRRLRPTRCRSRQPGGWPGSEGLPRVLDLPQTRSLCSLCEVGMSWVYLSILVWTPYKGTLKQWPYCKLQGGQVPCVGGTCVEHVQSPSTSSDQKEKPYSGLIRTSHMREMGKKLGPEARLLKGEKLGFKDSALKMVVSYFIITRYKRKSDEQEDEDAIVNRISLSLSTFTLAVSAGANYYIQWLNGSLIRGLWNLASLFSNLCLY